MEVKGNSQALMFDVFSFLVSDPYYGNLFWFLQVVSTLCYRMNSFSLSLYCMQFFILSLVPLLLIIFCALSYQGLFQVSLCHFPFSCALGFHVLYMLQFKLN